MIRIFIADDHAVVREGLKQIVAQHPEMLVAGEAANGYEALEKVRKEKYDVVVLDISMPGLSGLDVLKQLKSEMPSMPVLILSMHSEEQFAVRTLKAGASGYLTKESAPEELVSAILRISKGRKYISTSLAEKLALELESDREKPLHHSLSDREYQVLCLIASGKRVKQIAEQLHLSEKTVSTYRARILEKMGMKTNAELIRYAIKNGLLE
ncbi:MAG: response regulator [Candidatus Aminicenantales bacterium]